VPMEQRGGEVTPRPSRSRARRRDTVRRDCSHPGSPHTHGTRAAYVSDRCGCTRCRAANRSTEEQRTAAIAVGRSSPYADARPVREHLEHLRQQGLGIERIAQLSNVPYGTIRRLLSYSNEPETRPHRTRAENARRLLAIPLTNHDGSPRRLVTADATRKRIEALTAAGYSITELERLIGRPRASLRRSLSRRSVTAQTALSVGALYEVLNSETPPSTVHIPKLKPSCRDAPPNGGQSKPQTSQGGLYLHGYQGKSPVDSTSKRGRALYGCVRRSSVGNSRKSRRVASDVAAFQQAQRLNRAMARIGRPSKGDRDVLYTRVPRPVGDAIRALSDQTGMAISDVIAALAAKSLGMPEMAPQPPHTFDQQELPLKTA
jgi:hypothetical protein